MNKTFLVGVLILVLLVPSAFAGSQAPRHRSSVSSSQATRRRAATSSSAAGAAARPGSRRSIFRVAWPGPEGHAAPPARRAHAAPPVPPDQPAQPVLPAQPAQPAQQVRRPAGPQGATGPQGPPGLPAVTYTRVTAFGGDFEPTNASVSMTAACAEFGPYANGGAEGGSVFYGGFNGMRLGDIVNLVYTASYSTDNDTTASASRTCGCSRTMAHRTMTR